MQEVVPSVVAMAVSMVMASCRIFFQSSLFMVEVLSYELWFMIYEWVLLFLSCHYDYTLSFWKERSVVKTSCWGLARKICKALTCMHSDPSLSLRMTGSTKSPPLKGGRGMLILHRFISKVYRKQCQWNIPLAPFRRGMLRCVFRFFAIAQDDMMQ